MFLCCLRHFATRYALLNNRENEMRHERRSAPIYRKGKASSAYISGTRMQFPRHIEKTGSTERERARESGLITFDQADTRSRTALAIYTRNIPRSSRRAIMASLDCLKEDRGSQFIRAAGNRRDSSRGASGDTRQMRMMPERHLRGCRPGSRAKFSVYK